jgi:hypothetical protein
MGGFVVVQAAMAVGLGAVIGWAAAADADAPAVAAAVAVGGVRVDRLRRRAIGFSFETGSIFVALVAIFCLFSAFSFLSGKPIK